LEVFKIVALGISISVFVVVIKQVKPELAVAVLIAGSIVMILTITKYFSDVFEMFDLIVNKTGIDKGVVSAVLKIIGIGYLIEFSAGVCNDTGNSSIADKVILGGKVLIFIVAMPIVTNLLDIVVGLIP
jgi:stage III sporulation protein AD